MNNINLTQLTRVKIPLKHWIYSDLIASLECLLSAANFNVTVSENRLIDGALNIVFGFGSHFELAEPDYDYVIRKNGCYLFNVEQLGSSSTLLNSRYLTSLRAKPFLDYNYRNFENTDLPGVEFPVSPISGLTPKACDYSDRPIDFLFFGASNINRRKIILDRIEGFGFSTKIITNKYGSDLDDYLHSSKIVLNLHAYESRIFEALRCIRPASFGNFILSEFSFLPRAFDWSPYVYFANLETISRCELVYILDYAKEWYTRNTNNINRDYLVTKLKILMNNN